MNAEEVALLRAATDEMHRLRDRIHKLADQVQTHEMRLGEHTILLDVLHTSVETLRQNMATSEQLASGLATMSLKLDHLTQTVDPMRRGIYWIVTLIIGTVILAGMAFLLRTP